MDSWIHDFSYKKNHTNPIDYTWLPSNSSALYNALSQRHHQAKLFGLQRNRVITQQQYDTSFPIHMHTESSEMDITLLAVLIQNCLPTLPPPSTGWANKNPPLTDTTLASNVIRIRNFRTIYLILHHPLSTHLYSS